MKLMNQKLTKYTWLLPFISGICWGAAGIFVRTLEHDGLDNFSIIIFRMLIAALMCIALIFKDTIVKYANNIMKKVFSVEPEAPSGGSAI